ncbi:thioredoxin family protein [Halalkalibacter krulwichiae]|uniref:Thioredoxin n=1 Tax=Halalkalibacter krulwichiae TaxID=199441 RepID=A0A1X9MAB7_9BACI|nr:thioredoxin family protein [Halalkalibacter krulwichiae]ARK30365.1 Thioredoxin [Halalkalibacter krulwichiae]
MEEISSKKLAEKLADRDPITIVFVYSPLCGTCKLAEKMLRVVQSSFDALPMYSLNINHSPLFAQQWKVKSVPCLFIFQRGLGVERIYAFRSISYVHEIVKRYATILSLQEKSK